MNHHCGGQKKIPDYIRSGSDHFIYQCGGCQERGATSTDIRETQWILDYGRRLNFSQCCWNLVKIDGIISAEYHVMHHAITSGVVP